MHVPKSPDSPSVPLSRFRTILASPSGQRRMDALLAAEEPAAEVAALTSTELFQVLVEVGLEESGELLALATPEQVRGCLDLVVWRGDRFDVDALIPWLGALVALGSEGLAPVWDALDAELKALALQRLTRVYDLSLEEVPEEHAETGPIVTTPDTFFALELTATDETTVATVYRLIEDLYRADPSGTFARHAIMAARSELPSYLEEQCYRWRSGRMADMGYADPFEAIEVFRPLEPSSIVIGEDTEDRFPVVDTAARGDEGGDRASAIGTLPAEIAQGVVGVSFLARAIDRVSDPAEFARLEMALVVLVNKTLAAARISPGHSEALAVGAEQAAATLSIGLETVSRGDLARAEEALRSVSLTRLHRAGHTLVLRLARMARTLAARVAGAAGTTDDALLTLSLIHI